MNKIDRFIDHIKTAWRFADQDYLAPYRCPCSHDIGCEMHVCDFYDICYHGGPVEQRIRKIQRFTIYLPWIVNYGHSDSVKAGECDCEHEGSCEYHDCGEEDCDDDCHEWA